LEAQIAGCRLALDTETILGNWLQIDLKQSVCTGHPQAQQESKELLGFTTASCNHFWLPLCGVIVVVVYAVPITLCSPDYFMHNINLNYITSHLFA
jgi:hypothetical protein